MIITIQYNASVTALSQPFQNQFKAAVNAAVAYYEHVFTNPITITINVGWDEIGPTHVSISQNFSSVARSKFETGTDLTYAQLRTALQNRHNTDHNVIAYNSLPAADPTGNSLARYRITSAEKQALGLSTSNPTADLYIGLNGSNTWTFDPNNRAVSGAHDAIGALEHEISEGAMSALVNYASGLRPR